MVLAVPLASGAVTLHPASEEGYGVAYGPWRSSRIGGGGYVLNVVPTSDPQVHYTHSDVGGCLRSDDGGRTWRMLHGNLPTVGKAVYQCRSMAVHPTDPDTILIGTGTHVRGIEGGGIWRSADGGRTWEFVLEVQFDGNGANRKAGQLLQFDPTDPNRAWAATEKEGVWLSTDAGETWQSAGLAGHDFSHLLVDGTDPDRVWVGATGPLLHRSGLPSSPDWAETDDPGAGLWRTDDGGRTWRALQTGRQCIEFVQDPLDPAVLYEVRLDRGVFRSADRGETWEEWNTDLRIEPGERLRCYNAITAGLDFILVVDWKGRVHRLDSGTDRWAPQEFEREHAHQYWFGRGLWHRGNGCASIVVDPHDPDLWWQTDAYGLWQVTNDGADWTLRVDGLENSVIHSLVPDPVDPDVIHLGMGDNGYFVSRDGGQTFRQPNRVIYNLKALAVAPSDPDVLYATGSRSWAALDVFVSRDGGEQWLELPDAGLPPREGRRLNSIAVDPRDASLVYLAVHDVGDEGGVYRSTDGGEHWEHVSKGVPSEYRIKDNIFQIAHTLTIGADRVVYATFDQWPGPHGMWRSRDLGETWDGVPIPEGIWFGRSGAVCAHPAEPGAVLLATQRGLWRTDDGGDRWLRVYEPEAMLPAFSPRPPYMAVATTTTGPIASDDGGTTWAPLDRALPDKVWGKCCVAGDHILVGASSGVFWAATTQAGRGIKARRERERE